MPREPRQFDPDVSYRIRYSNGRYEVINTDTNRLMNKTFATRAAAQAHINKTKPRVAKIIEYHNRANRARASRAYHPPPRAPQRNQRRVRRGEGRADFEPRDDNTPPATPPRTPPDTPPRRRAARGTPARPPRRPPRRENTIRTRPATRASTRASSGSVASRTRAAARKKKK